MIGLTFHHLGLAVQHPHEAVTFLRGLGYTVGEAVFDAEQNVNLVMCTQARGPAVEIIYPGGGDGPVDSLVGRHAKGIVYHACYETADLEASLAALDQIGTRATCVTPPKPAALFGGRKVSFYNIAGMGLVEILETGRRW